MYKKAWKKIISSNNIVIASHVRADGDTIGSMLALYLVLKSFKKRVKIYNYSKNLPKKFEFLPNFSKITNKFDKNDVDLLITCDCANLKRTSLEKDGLFVVNIDHHKSNEFFGDINVVDEGAPSTSLVVFEMLLENNIYISKEIATCIYVGFVEDTGFFTYGSLHAKAMQRISKLVAYGVDMGYIGRMLKQNLPLYGARLKRHIYNELYLIKDAMVGVCVISEADFKSIGSRIEDTKNIANLVLELATVRLAIVIVQVAQNGVKISLRSKDINADEIARTFGGGGHMKAAGFELNYFEPEKIVEQIVEKIHL